jgi:hypothetical protein
VPTCGYSQTLNSLPDSSFITAVTGGTIIFSASTRNILDEGAHIVTVTSTLNSYPYTHPVPSCQSTLILTVNNPCATTSITFAPSIFEDLVAFIGYTTSIKSLYTYNDSESVARTVNTDVVDLCGEKQL